MSLKITDVERIVVDVPYTLRQQEIAARTVYNWSILELCKVTTDAGIVGWGETVVHYPYGQGTDMSVQRVLGKSPADLMQDDSLGAGLQMALYDVVGKALGVPCYKLMGQKVRDWVPISWWSNEASPEEWAGEARDAVRLGYTSFKVKQRPWWDIIAQVNAVREVVPEGFKLDADANGSMQNAAAAMPIMRKLQEYDLVAMFETPIPQNDIMGNRQLRQVISRPIAMHFGQPPYITAVREEVCDGFVIGGGASQVIREGTLASEASMPFWLQIVGDGLSTTWAAHLGAVLSHATWPAITCLNLYTDHLITKPIEVLGGFHQVPEAPGLGVEVDEDAIERHRVPAAALQACAKSGEVYNKPRPRIIRTVRYPDGSCVHMSSITPGMRLTPYTPGVRTEAWHEDGTRDWEELWDRIQEGAVRDRWAQLD